MKPIELENEINQIPGVITNGLFARQTPEVVLVAKNDGILQL